VRSSVPDLSDMQPSLIAQHSYVFDSTDVYYIDRTALQLSTAWSVHFTISHASQFRVTVAHDYLFGDVRVSLTSHNSITTYNSVHISYGSEIQGELEPGTYILTLSVADPKDGSVAVPPTCIPYLLFISIQNK